MGFHTISYSQYLLCSDAQMVGRVCSIMNDEGYSKAGEPGIDLAWKYIEDIAAKPGLAEAYHAALLNEVDQPGAADDVITDGQLLSAVVAVMNDAGISP